ncbi:MAG: MBL fold metallo-hydrolase [Acetobacteraceae bacterium]|nr:MBL fold metallo-hydrolase [Acetobacteraceae bacterium]
MQVTFLGACRGVTGSAHLVQGGGTAGPGSPRFQGLLDCGLFQGGQKAEEQNREPFPFDPRRLDFVILSHAHIDHSGRLPLLVRHGFCGPIFATPATCDLCRLLLLDSAHIQEADSAWLNRRRQRSGLDPVRPLYSVDDVEAALRLLRPVGYGRRFSPAPGLEARLVDAGHILGSAFVELWEGGASGPAHLLFSGDLGHRGKPIVRDPEPARGAECLVLEGTYGDRVHEPSEEASEALRRIIAQTHSAGGNLVIPSFAVGRTQELLYLLNGLIQTGRVPDLPVYLDSPLAIGITEVFEAHPECYDRDALRRVRQHDDPFDFPGLRLVRTVEESRALNSASGIVIIASSGMAEGGRVRHHLKHNLWRPESTVLFVGYQAQGTLGRRILDGARTVAILGEEIAVRARIAHISGLSAHADASELVEWVEAMPLRPRRAYLVHAEPQAAEALALSLRERTRIEVSAPALGEAASIPTPG